MKYSIPIYYFFFFLIACEKIKKKSESLQNITLDYATGFTIEYVDTYKKIHIKKAENENSTFLLVPKNRKVPANETETQIIRTPIEKIILTSTTHIPILEQLGVAHSLVGFPDPNYISSKKTRKRIEENKVQNIGNSQTINTELVLALQPDLFMGFESENNNKAIQTIKNSGIPVLNNRDWQEQTPLGRAEWIRLFGALFGKEKEADSIFNSIKTAYLATKEIATKATTSPSVFSGALFQDVWYVPAGDSFVAQYFKDAHTNYLWKDSKGRGSLALNFENVLDKAKDADFWIGCDTYKNKEDLMAASEHYLQFTAFKENTYTYGHLRGETEGLLYYEIGPLRPDLILKDILKITHPELLPNYTPYFFKKLE